MSIKEKLGIVTRAMALLAIVGGAFKLLSLSAQRIREMIGNRDFGVNHQFLDLYKPSLQKFEEKPYVFHFIQHTHIDAGWVETMKDYEDLATDGIHSTSVEYISDHPQDILSRLSLANVEFIKSFLERFPQYTQQFQRLVKEKKIEMLNSAIVMPDQSSTTFEDFINVYEYGREYSIRVFGADTLSRIGWAIDTFGISANAARLLSLMGYDFFVYSRIPLHQKIQMRFNHTLVSNWETSPYPEETIMGYTLTDHYTFPEPMGDEWAFPHLLHPKFNLATGLLKLFSTITEVARTHREINIPLYMGTDFYYRNFSREVNFLRQQYLAIECNSKSLFKRFTFKHSSFSQYLDALIKEKINYSSHSGDFFPTSTHHLMGFVYWSGTYFNKPGLKLLTKQLTSLTRSIGHLLAYFSLRLGTTTALSSEAYSLLENIRFTSGLCSHHDIITGVSYRHVVVDYLHRIEEARSSMDKLFGMFPGRPFGGWTISLFLFATATGPGGSDNPIVFSVQALDRGGNKRVRVVHDLQGEGAMQKVQWMKGGANLMVLDKQNNSWTSIAHNRYRFLCVHFHCEISFNHFFKPFEHAVFKFTTNANSNAVAKLDLKSNQTIKSSKGYYARCIGPHIEIVRREKVLLVITLSHFSNKFADILDRMYYQQGPYAFSTHSRRPTDFNIDSCFITGSPDGTQTVIIKYTKSGNPCESSLSVTIPTASEEATTGVSGAWAMTITTSPLLPLDNPNLLLRISSPRSPLTKLFADSNGLTIVDRTHRLTDKIEGNLSPITAAVIATHESDRSGFLLITDRAAGAVLDNSSNQVFVLFNRANMGRDNMGSVETSMEPDKHVFHYELFLYDEPTAKSKATEVLINRFREYEVDHILSPLIYFTAKDHHSDPSKLRNDPQLDVVTIADTPSNNSASYSLVRSLLDIRPDGIMLRLYNMQEPRCNTSQCVLPLPESASVSIPSILDFFKQRYPGMANQTLMVEERSLDYNLPISKIHSQNYTWRDVEAMLRAYKSETTSSFGISLPALKIRTFRLYK